MCSTGRVFEKCRSGLAAERKPVDSAFTLWNFNSPAEAEFKVLSKAIT